MPSTTATPEIDRLIAPECRTAIRTEIASLDGAEVFFVGRLDGNLCVEEVESYAFGNRSSVPALLQYAKPGDVIIHNHPSGNLEPSAADIEISSLAGERGIGSYIIDNECETVRTVVKATRLQVAEPIEIEALAGMLSPGGKLADRLEGYEFRPAQIEMLTEVSRAFNEDGVAVVEADTGTGKSMAYLLPAIAWSLKNHEKVVIATYTINLQEQLIEKDLPLLRQTLDLDFDAVLLKGRNNYLCRRKTDYVSRHPDFARDEAHADQLDSIFEWVKTTRDGSREDLGFAPDTGVWDLVKSESDNCLRTRCPFYHNCFFYNARRRAARAQLIVANHHLVMADLAVRAETDNYTGSAVLPAYHRLILDEAHHVDDVATQYFGSRVTGRGTLNLLGRLASVRTGDGLLRFISRKIHERLYPMPEDNARKWMMRLAGDFLTMHRDLADGVDEAMDRIAMALDELEGLSADRPVDLRRRVTPELTEHPMWEPNIRSPLIAVVTTARPYLEALGELYRALHATIEEETPENMSPLLELRAATGRIESQLKNILRFLTKDEEQCRWIEYRRRPNSQGRAFVALCTAPLDTAPLIREKILRRFRTVVMTSATLAIEKKFDYFLASIGAQDQAKLGLLGSASVAPGNQSGSGRERLLTTMMLTTPFDYDNQVYVGVPADLPSPLDADFPTAAARFISRALRITQGRAFVLFTSYRMLNEIHDIVSPDLEAEGFPCLKQGSTGRSLLTQSFREEIGTVLFGASSFWEGVDIPGEALSCVIITRLPFGVPDDPIVEARVEHIRRAGGNPFSELIVPQAVIRFRQGFGRLIRRREDRGAVLICDSRIVKKNYGRGFLRSLPTDKIHIAPASEVEAGLKDFFDNDPTASAPDSPDASELQRVDSFE